MPAKLSGKLAEKAGTEPQPVEMPMPGVSSLAVPNRINLRCRTLRGGARATGHPGRAQTVHKVNQAFGNGGITSLYVMSVTLPDGQTVTGDHRPDGLQPTQHAGGSKPPLAGATPKRLPSSSAQQRNKDHPCLRHPQALILARDTRGASVPLFEPTFDPRRLREVRFVAVEERRDEDESRPPHVQVRLDPDQQADLVLANNQGALSRRRRAPNAIPDACELYRAG